MVLTEIFENIDQYFHNLSPLFLFLFFFTVMMTWLINNSIQCISTIPNSTLKTEKPKGNIFMVHLIIRYVKQRFEKYRSIVKYNLMNNI